MVKLVINRKYKCKKCRVVMNQLEEVKEEPERVVHNSKPKQNENVGWFPNINGKTGIVERDIDEDFIIINDVKYKKSKKPVDSWISDSVKRGCQIL